MQKKVFRLIICVYECKKLCFATEEKQPKFFLITFLFHKKDTQQVYKNVSYDLKGSPSTAHHKTFYLSLTIIEGLESKMLPLTSRAIFLASILSAFFVTVSAECPNACSSHGKCGAYDACECYRNWMSNDCSERE